MSPPSIRKRLINANDLDMPRTAFNIRFPSMRNQLSTPVIIFIIFLTAVLYYWVKSDSSRRDVDYSGEMGQHDTMAAQGDTLSTTTQIWSWRCVGEGEHKRCVRERTSNSPAQTSLETCKLTCSPYASLFPRPKNAELGKTTTRFIPDQITHSFIDCKRKIKKLLTKAVDIFQNTVSKYHPDYVDGHAIDWGTGYDIQNLHIEFNVPGLNEHLELSVKETYTLQIEKTGDRIAVSIEAPNFFGARHALETLSQLIAYDPTSNTLQIVTSATIVDGPEFPYRGVLLDTARSFIPVEDIKRTLDGMSYNKLNTFHWHITDTHAFPLVLRSVPQMAQFGASSPRNVYTPHEVRDIVEYARLRGIRVLPELDGPSHMGLGWQWGEEYGLGKLVVCLEEAPWSDFCAEPPCGQLNLANTKIYSVLQDILREMSHLFGPLDLFHFGGDEVVFNCWNTSKEMTDWLDSKKLPRNEETYYKQWSIYQKRVHDLLKEGNEGNDILSILWTSTLTSRADVDKYISPNDYIIQLWSMKDSPTIGHLLKKGYKVIFSNSDTLYLDCGAASWVGDGNNWCSPYKGWQMIYDNDIIKISDDSVNGSGSHYNVDQILGAEVTLWTEQADRFSLDNKLWPRASAHAERLWTNPSTNYTAAESRIIEHRERLVSRGLSPERLQPDWCRQNEKLCRDPRLLLGRPVKYGIHAE